MEDFLAKLSSKELAAWYERLADKTAQNKWGGTEMLASRCLRLWLENRTPYNILEIDAPKALRNSPYMAKALMYHRLIYLTEKKARLASGDGWAGIIPRLQGKGHKKLTRLTGVSMEYESLVDIPISAAIFGPEKDKDLLYALHGLQLRTEVTLSCSKMSGSNLIHVVFVNFQAQMKNRYEWDPEQQIKVENPDYKSRLKKAVAPKEKTVVVLNKHAKRLEDAGLAAPYYLESEFWYVDSALCGPAQVDPEKRI